MRYNRIIALVAIPLALLGCGQSAEPPANQHDARYSVYGDSAPASVGDCVLDSVTGLLWEVKTSETGLHAAKNTYSWYNPEQAHDELDYRGTSNAGDCEGGACDTWSFVAAVNNTGHCGHSDWRVPSRDELFSISDRARSAPTINRQYFPNARAAEYWTSNDYSFQPDSAWAWSFEYGHDRVDWKKTPKFVRLVRGHNPDLEAVKE